MKHVLNALATVRDWLVFRFPCPVEEAPEPLDWTWDELATGVSRRNSLQGYIDFKPPVRALGTPGGQVTPFALSPGENDDSPYFRQGPSQF